MEDKLYERANRYLGEQPVEEPEIEPVDPGMEPGTGDELEAPVAEDEGIEIYFDNLDNESQKKVMDALMDQVNAAEDDTYSNDKITEAMTKTPLFVLKPGELKRQLDIDV